MLPGLLEVRKWKCLSAQKRAHPGISSAAPPRPKKRDCRAQNADGEPSPECRRGAKPRMQGRYRAQNADTTPSPEWRRGAKRKMQGRWGAGSEADRGTQTRYGGSRVQGESGRAGEECSVNN